MLAVVKRDGMIRGLLISFVDGENLEKAMIVSETDRFAVTYQIISVAVGLEKVGFYHSDLQCRNIVRQQSDGAIYFIDFGGGITHGFYPKESEYELLLEEISPKDAIYILGKALWQFWTCPCGVPAEEQLDSIPERARNLIHKCCIAPKFNSMAELQKAWCRDT